MEAYKKAVKLNPCDAQSFSALGELFADTGENLEMATQQAVRRLEQVIGETQESRDMGKLLRALAIAGVLASGGFSMTALTAAGMLAVAGGTLATVAPLATAPGAEVADLPDLPARLNDWLGQAGPATCHLESPAAPGLTVEFARL